MTDEATLKIIKERYRNEKKRKKILSEIASGFSGSSHDKKRLDTLIQQNNQLLRELQTSLLIDSLSRGSVLGNIHFASLRFQSVESPSQENTLKNECLFVLEGEVEVEYGSERSLQDPVMHPFMKTKLGYGQSLNIQSGCPYRIIALTDAQVIEIGTGRGHIGKTIRIEDDYGRE